MSAYEFRLGLGPGASEVEAGTLSQVAKAGSLAVSGSVVLGSHHGDQHCYISSAFAQQVVRTTQSMMAEQFVFRPHAHSFSVQCNPTCKLDYNAFPALVTNTPRPCIAADNAHCRGACGSY